MGAGNNRSRVKKRKIKKKMNLLSNGLLLNKSIFFFNLFFRFTCDLFFLISVTQQVYLFCSIFFFLRMQRTHNNSHHIASVSNSFLQLHFVKQVTMEAKAYHHILMPQCKCMCVAFYANINIVELFLQSMQISENCV